MLQELSCIVLRMNTLEKLVKLLKLENVTFGDKEIAELPNQTKAIPNFKLKHNIKNIYKDLKRGD